MDRGGVRDESGFQRGHRTSQMADSFEICFEMLNRLKVLRAIVCQLSSFYRRGPLEKAKVLGRFRRRIGLRWSASLSQLSDLIQSFRGQIGPFVRHTLGGIGIRDLLKNAL